MFKELRNSEWFPVVGAFVGVWVFVTVEVLWMVATKAAMGR